MVGKFNVNLSPKVHYIQAFSNGILFTETIFNNQYHLFVFGFWLGDGGASWYANSLKVLLFYLSTGCLLYLKFVKIQKNYTFIAAKHVEHCL